jgi:hypothetical protein
MMEDPLIGNHQPGRFFVLVPSVRPSAHNPTTAVLVELENQLARLGYPIYNPQTDDDSALLGSVPETRGGKAPHATEGKIVICTYGQSKGRERDIAIVLGFDAAAYYRGCERDSTDAAQMPPRLFVACTRAREYLVVVETAGRARTRTARGDSGRIEGPLPFLRLGAEGYSGLASHPFMALGLSPGPPPPMLSTVGAVSPVPHPGWVLYHSGTQRPPDLELYGCTPDGSVERVQEQSRAAVGLRGPATAPAAAPATARFASPDDLTRYWTMDKLSAARASLAPFVSVQDPAPGPHPTVAFPYRVASAAEHEPGPGTRPTYTAVADIVCLAVRTVWELLVRPGETPQAVREVRDRVTPSWSRECLCEAEPALGDRLREDWRSALGAWAQDGRVCVPRSAEELEGFPIPVGHDHFLGTSRRLRMRNTSALATRPMGMVNSLLARRGELSMTRRRGAASRPPP